MAGGKENFKFFMMHRIIIDLNQDSLVLRVRQKIAVMSGIENSILEMAYWRWQCYSIKLIYKSCYWLHQFLAALQNMNPHYCSLSTIFFLSFLFFLQADRLCDEISGFVEYGFDLVQQGGTWHQFCQENIRIFIFVIKMLSPANDSNMTCKGRYCSYQRFHIQTRWKVQFCFVLTPSPRLSTFLNSTAITAIDK